MIGHSGNLSSLTAKKYLDKKLIVKMNGGRKVSGIMIGFDHFMNIVLDR